ncbi:MAG: toll/interleukin-1 receptor domain-containing protein [Nitrospinae bacterium]|nr:toll/interleukin-1 receptor domain-containing protein [Nitrospinota bacterium]
MPIITIEQQLKDTIGQIEEFKFCGPSDDPDEQTAVLYGFRGLVKAFKFAARGIPDEQLRNEAQKLADPDTLYEAYDIYSDISAMLPEIRNNLLSSDLEPHDPLDSNNQTETLKAFISYSTINKQIAGQVKETLDGYSIDSFLAHEDIGVSEKWKDRIVEELKSCHIFVPLLSKEFIQSDWGSQEIGFAFSRSNILILPLLIDDKVPFGFISHIQGKSIALDHVQPELLVKPILDRFPHGIIPNLIDKLAGASNYRNAESLMLPLVPYFDKFNDIEINAFVTASIENRQIWEAADCCQTYLPQLLKIHRSKIEPDKLKVLEAKLH